ncbi:hypothetical protein BU23DRAFT_565518 [Bimuria novae-zelandiae CBS 107.79]|uniref:Uncharacterized protein n=1 Tax=Bimuria novae-zelandiae CBS 107.79 TaxID=1447943 RepID=A0A6A5VK78_9PLEO|nr:hypothetical protein BU23DRAFT_565518 [Bimuria novae-zelandiae CBS 107.79]
MPSILCPSPDLTANFALFLDNGHRRSSLFRLISLAFINSTSLLHLLKFTGLVGYVSSAFAGTYRVTHRRAAMAADTATEGTPAPTRMSGLCRPPTTSKAQFAFVAERSDPSSVNALTAAVEVQLRTAANALVIVLSVLEEAVNGSVLLCYPSSCGRRMLHLSQDERIRPGLASNQTPSSFMVPKRRMSYQGVVSLLFDNASNAQSLLKPTINESKSFIRLRYQPLLTSVNTSSYSQSSSDLVTSFTEPIQNTSLGLTSGALIFHILALVVRAEINVASGTVSMAPCGPGGLQGCNPVGTRQTSKTPVGMGKPKVHTIVDVGVEKEM